jgi:hypothetical protein
MYIQNSHLRIGIMKQVVFFHFDIQANRECFNEKLTRESIKYKSQVLKQKKNKRSLKINFTMTTNASSGSGHFEIKNSNDVHGSVFPYNRRRKSCIDEFELFMTIMPRDPELEEIDPDMYEQLAHDLFTWDRYFDMFKYRVFTFQK